MQPDISLGASTLRRSASPLVLLKQALGSPKEAIYKLDRLLQGAADFLDTKTLDERLLALKQKGIIEEIPTRLQLVIGGIDMLRFWISPAAADYYNKQGINYAFHQLLRFLDDPRSMMNPVGLLNSKDAIIGHLMQVVHADPDYDLQLLEMFPDGIESLVHHLEQMLDGTHPRHSSIQAIIEEPDYHRRLLDYVKKWQQGEATEPLRRENIVQNESFLLRAKTFGNLTNSMRYFTRLPKRPLLALLHLLYNRTFPESLAV